MAFTDQFNSSSSTAEGIYVPWGNDGSLLMPGGNPEADRKPRPPPVQRDPVQVPADALNDLLNAFKTFKQGLESTPSSEPDSDSTSVNLESIRGHLKDFRAKLAARESKREPEDVEMRHLEELKDLKTVVDWLHEYSVDLFEVFEEAEEVGKRFGSLKKNLRVVRDHVDELVKQLQTMLPRLPSDELPKLPDWKP